MSGDGSQQLRRPEACFLLPSPLPSLRAGLNVGAGLPRIPTQFFYLYNFPIFRAIVDEVHFHGLEYPWP